MTRRPRLLTLMGSGETAPTMAKVHRMLAGRLGPDPVDAVLLDTPYGFQENAADISRRACGYFASTVGTPLRVASWTRPDDDTWRREQALALVRDAGLVFAGPGSPTYAMRVWRETGLRAALADLLDRGGCVTFGSAAAACLGIAVVPVYEIYKVGADPHWIEGMDLTAVLGLRAAVIPHFDNTEGGTHDTRYCYLGERRLRAMEAMLDPPGCVLGIDEHTAAVFDLDANTLTVQGRGVVTVRHGGTSTVFGPGRAVGLAELRAAATGEASGPGAAAGQAAPGRDGEAELPSLHGETERLAGVFESGLRAGDVQVMVSALLDLEQAIVDWSADTEEEDGPDAPRAVLRGMVVRLGELATIGARDPARLLAPFVDALIDLRDRARSHELWAVADDVRGRLTAAGVTVRDTPDGTVWELTSAES